MLPKPIGTQLPSDSLQAAQYLLRPGSNAPNDLKYVPAPDSALMLSQVQLALHSSGHTGTSKCCRELLYLPGCRLRHLTSDPLCRHSCTYLPSSIATTVTLKTLNSGIISAAAEQDAAQSSAIGICHAGVC